MSTLRLHQTATRVRPHSSHFRCIQTPKVDAVAIRTLRSSPHRAAVDQSEPKLCRLPEYRVPFHFLVAVGGALLATDVALAVAGWWMLRALRRFAAPRPTDKAAAATKRAEVGEWPYGA